MYKEARDPRIHWSFIPASLSTWGAARRVIPLRPHSRTQPQPGSPCFLMLSLGGGWSQAACSVAGRVKSAHRAASEDPGHVVGPVQGRRCALHHQLHSTLTSPGHCLYSGTSLNEARATPVFWEPHVICHQRDRWHMSVSGSPNSFPSTGPLFSGHTEQRPPSLTDEAGLCKEGGPLSF